MVLSQETFLRNRLVFLIEIVSCVYVLTIGALIENEPQKMTTYKLN